MARSLLIGAHEWFRSLLVLKAPIEITTAPPPHRPVVTRDRDRSLSTGFSALIDNAAAAERPEPKVSEARGSRDALSQSPETKSPPPDTKPAPLEKSIPQDAAPAVADDPSSHPDQTQPSAVDGAVAAALPKPEEASAIGIDAQVLTLSTDPLVGKVLKAKLGAKDDPASSPTEGAASSPILPGIFPDSLLPVTLPAENSAAPAPQVTALPAVAILPVAPPIVTPQAPPPAATSVPPSVSAPRAIATTAALAPKAEEAPDAFASPNSAAPAPVELPPGVTLPKAAQIQAKVALSAENNPPVAAGTDPEATVLAPDAAVITSSQTAKPPAIDPAAGVKPDEAPTAEKVKVAKAASIPETAPHPSSAAKAPVQGVAAGTAPELTISSFSLPSSAAPLNIATPISPAAHLTASIASDTPVPLNGLAVEIATRSLSGATSFAVRLDPADLGRIDVRLDVDKHGQVTSHLTVEKPETLAMLRQDAPQLQRALNDAGLKTADTALQFSLGDQASAQQHADRGAGRHAQRLIVQPEENIVAPPQLRGYGRMLGSRSGIDIRV